MKILYITSNFESVQKHLLEMFTKKGDDINLFLYRVRHRKEICDFPRNVTYYNLPSHLRGPIFLITRLKKIANFYIKKMNEDKPEILHGNMAFSDGYICRYISKKYNIPYVISFRDTDMNSNFLWKLPWLRKELFKNLLGAKRVIFLSSSYKNKLIDKLPLKYKEIISCKSIVIPNGIDDIFINNSFFRKKAPKSLKLIFIGKVGPRKNLELTVEAIKKLLNKGINISLDVVGVIEDEYYEKLIFSNSFISYHEPCGKEKILSLLRSADIFAMVSHTETFGLVYAEAMSQGVPVLYTRGQGFDNQFEDGVVGYSVSDYNSDELAKKIELVWDNYLEFSQNCTILSKKFSWQKIIMELRKVYEE